MDGQATSPFSVPQCDCTSTTGPGCKLRFARSSPVVRMSSQVSQFVHLPKSEEGHLMPFRKSPLIDSIGVAGMAQDWGKIVARRVHEEVGPDPDLDADEIERMAATAACALAKGTIEEFLRKKAALLGADQPCPVWKRLCPVGHEPRKIHFWGGEVASSEPKCHCPTCRRDFFPSTPGFTPHAASIQPLDPGHDPPGCRQGTHFSGGGRGPRSMGGSHHW